MATGQRRRSKRSDEPWRSGETMTAPAVLEDSTAIEFKRLAAHVAACETGTNYRHM